MSNKKLPILLILMISLWISTFGSSISSGIADNQARLAWLYEPEGISIQVYAPPQAYPGDVVPLTVKVNATEDLLDVYVILEIFGSKYENCSHWNTTSFKVLWNENLNASEGVTKEYNLEVPSDADPGLVYSYIICKWMTLDLDEYSKYDSFSVTYLENKDFETLRNEYAELQNKYEDLNASYTELKSKHQSEIGSTRNLVYILAATTIVSAITAFILLMRRPKRLWA